MEPIEIRTIDIKGQATPLQTIPVQGRPCQERPCQATPVQEARECPMPTPEETHVYFERCEEAKTVDMGSVEMDQGGRILDVALTLRHVCPHKRTAVGVTLTEVDAAGHEYARGFKCVTVTAHQNEGCCDIRTPRMRFILPEDLRVDGENSVCCGRRHFILRAATHCVDTCVTMR